jgi:hypothetical protein
MTEAKWLRAVQPGDLFAFASSRAVRASERKWRLFAAACHRRIDVRRPPEETEESDAVVALAERSADGLASAEQLAEAAPCRHPGAEEGSSWIVASDPAVSAARMFVQSNSRKPTRKARAALLRELFGNPFREAPFDPAWRTPAVASLAIAAYEERLTSSFDLDPVRLAILADALEDGGCSDDVLLSHLRSAGPHVRGCWAVDLCLGKD